MSLINNRIDLANKTAKGIVAEIGVASGVYSEIILQSKIQKLYLIDCWQTQDGEYKKDPCNVSTEYQNMRFEKIKKKFGNNEKINILKMYSNQAAKLFADEYFDWIYIDANHTKKAVKEDLNLWWPKVKFGGYLCGHDYVSGYKWIEVIPAVDEFCNHHHIKLETTNERIPSWFLKKQHLTKLL